MDEEREYPILMSVSPQHEYPKVHVGTIRYRKVATRTIDEVDKRIAALSMAQHRDILRALFADQGEIK